MQYAERYVVSAENIISRYDGTLPLNHYLKQFFAADKKYGSKDRKAISHACYCFYRLGKSLMDLPVRERIIAGIFLCTDELQPWERIFPPEWMTNAGHLEQKIQQLESVYSFQPAAIFPWPDQLSGNFDHEALCISHLRQPDLHLRVRPGKKEKVIAALKTAAIDYNAHNANCLALPNATKIDGLLSLNTDVVIQDLSSQRVGDLIPVDQLRERSTGAPTKVWDCCAASGGKSMLVYDLLQDIDLTVSDIRPSVMRNLEKRFAEAGIDRYRSFVSDVGAVYPDLGNFDLVICDAPCTGSGTWSRTPEQLYFFDEDKTGYYANLQKKITWNVTPAVAPGGYFLYITCSVFKQENEDVVDFIQNVKGLKLVEMRTFPGYGQKADTMFAALFTAGSL
jgi:16S rRNA (cytosine967-C5)-methyltransferase